MTTNRNTILRRRCGGFILGLLTLAIHGEIPRDSPLRHAPVVRSADAAKLPRPTFLDTPQVRTLVGYTRRVLHLHDGHTLAVFSFSDNGLANWLFLVDSRDLSADRYEMPNHDVGSHSAALGSDGNIYCMPYGTGRAYKFDTKSRKFSELPPIGLPPGELTWDAIGSKSGNSIYFGTYPNACLVRYDIGTQKAEVRPHIAPNATYVMDFSEDETGIHCHAWAPGDRWLTVHGDAFIVEHGKKPASAPAFVPPSDSSPNESARNLTKIGDRRFAMGWPSGRLLEFADGRTIERGDPHAPAELWYLEPAGEALVGISHYGATFRFDLKSNQFEHRQLANLAAGGNRIMFLEAITPHCVIGANYSQQNLFRVDPQTGTVQSFNSMVAAAPGELTCAIGFEGQAYIGAYSHAMILQYDPQRAMSFLQNPRELISLHDRFAQTRPRDVATDGRHVFFTFDSDYGKLGGALAEVDPSTGHVEAFAQPVKDQNLPSLAFDRKSHMLWLSTDRWGQQRSAPPTQATALLAEWDPEQKRIVKTLAPWPVVDEIEILGCTGDGILVVAAAGELALIDTTSATVLWHGRCPIGAANKFRRGADGAYYCLGNGTLYRWQFSDNSLTPIAITAGCTYLTEYAPGQWALANNASVYRFRQ